MITVTTLRKTFTEQGIKGFGKARREDFEAYLNEAHVLAIIEDQNLARKAETKPAKRGFCTECGRKEDFRASGLCEPCREYGEWENTHSDNAHESVIQANSPVTRDEAAEIAACPVCHPELDTRKAKATGRSRAGMVIVAKGSEIHKSEVFKAAAEAAGWTVTVTATEEGRFYADAHRTTHMGSDDAVQLAWDGRAYDYTASSARINGKDRKVRNLKEALRILAA
jgi:hypothetical protein